MTLPLDELERIARETQLNPWMRESEFWPVFSPSVCLELLTLIETSRKLADRYRLALEWCRDTGEGFIAKKCREALGEGK